MRILNRPMFRYGGPIREGVMHGMRNNYRSGQLVRPGPGRPGYQGEPFNYWKNLLGASKKYFGPTGKIGKIIKTVRRAPQVVKGIPKNLQGIFVKKATTPGITSSGAGQTFLKNLKDFSMTTPAWLRTAGTKAKDLYTRAPKKSIIGTGVAAPYVIDMAKKIPWKGVGDIIKAPYEKWKDVLGIESKPDDGGDGGDGGDGTDKIITGIGEGAQFKEDTAPIITAEMREKIAKDAQNKRLKSYLDMMGYDSAKKTAMSDALIDASALVQDASTEAGALKHADWGKLINRMIQTTSKRYDKPEQIREAVGLMATKAAIEKDLTADTDALKTEALKLNIEKSKKDLKGNSFAENKILTSKESPGQPGYDLAVELTKGKDFKGNLVDSTDWDDALEDMQDDPTSKGLNEKQLIKKYTNKLIEGKGYEDGDYTVGDNLVRIKDSLVISVE